MVNLPPVSRIIPARDEPNEASAIRKLQELDGLVTGGATVYTGRRVEEKRHSFGGVLMVRESETCFLSLTWC